jgi:hypothetical protein
MPTLASFPFPLPTFHKPALDCPQLVYETFLNHPSKTVIAVWKKLCAMRRPSECSLHVRLVPKAVFSESQTQRMQTLVVHTAKRTSFRDPDLQF